MTRKETMRRVRAQAQLVQRLCARMKEYAADGIRSPGLDGMPRARGCAPSGVMLRYEKRDFAVMALFAALVAVVIVMKVLGI